MARPLLWFGRGCALRACDAANGVERVPPIQLDRPAELAHSPDGRFLVLTAKTGRWTDPGRLVTFWDTTTWKKRFEWESEAVANAFMAVLPGGRTLVVLNGARKVELRNAADGHSLAGLRLDNSEFYNCLDISPDGRWLAIGGFCDRGFYGIIRMIKIDGTTFRPWQPRP